MATPTPNTLALLQATYPGKINLDAKEVGAICGTTVASIRTLRCRGKFNIPSFTRGGKHAYDIRDVAAYLDARSKPAPKRGAPTKAQRIAAAQNHTAK